MEIIAKAIVLIMFLIIFGAVITESILEQKEKYEREKEKR